MSADGKPESVISEELGDALSAFHTPRIASSLFDESEVEGRSNADFKLVYFAVVDLLSAGYVASRQRTAFSFKISMCNDRWRIKEFFQQAPEKWCVACLKQEGRESSQIH